MVMKTHLHLSGYKVQSIVCSVLENRRKPFPMSLKKTKSLILNRYFQIRKKQGTQDLF